MNHFEQENFEQQSAKQKSSEQNQIACSKTSLQSVANITTNRVTAHSKMVASMVTIGMSMTLLIACNNQTIPVDKQKTINPVIYPPTNTAIPKSYPTQPQPATVPTDSMRGLIINRQTQPITTAQKNSTVVYSNNAEFKHWLDLHSYQKSEILAYQNYLQSQLGTIPPIDQLIASARDARACGYEPYEVPPAALWQNIVPTLQLLQQLKRQGYLPNTTEIRSVYRNPALNQCAGGAGESKHITNGAMDIWIPENDGNRWAVESTFDGLCQFWQSQGQGYNLGLGLYSTGSIHLDTQGYRKWGANHSSSSSPCRF